MNSGAYVMHGSACIAMSSVPGGVSEHELKNCLDEELSAL